MTEPSHGSGRLAQRLSPILAMPDRPTGEGQPGPSGGAAIADLSEDEQRRRIVAEARSWIATPFHHAARVKGAGVDCGQLIIAVYANVGLIEAFDPGSYPPDFMMHRSEERYLNFILERARRVDKPQAGDVFVIRFGRTYSHGGIVTKPDPFTVIHAFMPHRMVVEDEVLHCRTLALRFKQAIFASYWG